MHCVAFGCELLVDGSVMLVCNLAFFVFKLDCVVLFGLYTAQSTF